MLRGEILAIHKIFAVFQLNYSCSLRCYYLLLEQQDQYEVICRHLCHAHDCISSLCCRLGRQRVLLCQVCWIHLRYHQCARCMQGSLPRYHWLRIDRGSTKKQVQGFCLEARTTVRMRPSLRKVDPRTLSLSNWQNLIHTSAYQCAQMCEHAGDSSSIPDILVQWPWLNTPLTDPCNRTHLSLLILYIFSTWEEFSIEIPHLCLFPASEQLQIPFYHGYLESSKDGIPEAYAVRIWYT